MSNPRLLSVIAALALVSAGVLGLGLVALHQQSGTPVIVTSPAQTAWSETKWSFPIDQWGTGRAYVCKAADCGSEVTLLLRAKLGFCNCTSGVADDEELERVSDLEFAGNGRLTLGDGRPITVHWMKGRSRSYAVRDQSVPARSALALAINDRCDAIVATALIAAERPDVHERAVLDFLNGERVRKWAETALGI
jgi:hypothetical protein